MVWDETAFHLERENAKVITDMTLMQMVVSSILSKKAGKELAKRLKKLDSSLKHRGDGS